MAAVASVSAPALADQMFTTNGAQANFTVNNGSITLVLTDTASTAPTSQAQLLSDISFSVAGGTTISTGTVTPTGNAISCADGVGCSSTMAAINAWTLGMNGSVGSGGAVGGGTYLLTSLVGSNKSLIMGSAAPSCTGSPNKCPGGIGNSAFQPYIQGSATFTLSMPGVVAGSQISNVNFSFGTAPETVLAAVPIPAAAWLFGSGLLGLIAIARRRSKTVDAPMALNGA